MNFPLRTAAPLAAALLLAPAAGAQVDRYNKPRETWSTDKQPSKGARPAKDVKYPDTPRKDVNAQNDLRNKRAPAFKVEKWLSEEPRRENKTVLIDFWATWCGPCKKLTPTLKKWQETYPDDLVVIGVSNEAPATVENYIRANQVRYAMAVDSKQTMAKAIGVGGIPHVLVISSDGIVRWQGFPMDEDALTDEKLAQIIEADRAERARRAEAAKKAREKKDAPKAPEPTPPSPEGDKPQQPAPAKK